MTVNGDLIRTRSQDIEAAITTIQHRTQRRSREEFVTNQTVVDAVCYRLLVAIEAALAMCYHVAARRLHKTPEDYAACFGAPGQAGLVSSDLSERLQQMARFRNLVVHVYGKVDPGRVYDILQNNLDDLRSLANAMLALIA